MKQIIKGTVLLLLAGVFATSANAQDKWRMELGYNVSSPVGSFKTNEVKNTSFRGVTGAVSYALNPKFSLGLNLGYQSYYQRFDRQLYKGEDGQTISAVKTNAIELMPVLLRGTYMPMGNTTTKVQPYLSAGAGINVVNYQQYYGEFGGADFSAPLALQAGAGVIVPIGTKQTSFKLGATYNHSGYTQNGENIKLGNVGIHAGLVFPFK